MKYDTPERCSNECNFSDLRYPLHRDSESDNGMRRSRYFSNSDFADRSNYPQKRSRLRSVFNAMGIASLIVLSLAGVDQPALRAQSRGEVKQEQRQAKQVENGRRAMEKREGQQQIQNRRGMRLVDRNDRRIPEENFRQNFGSSRLFRANIVNEGGFSRFQYGGVWFGFNNTWPVGWAYTDDVYIDYLDGGYVLCNPAYPDVYIGVSVER